MRHHNTILNRVIIAHVVQNMLVEHYGNFIRLYALNIYVTFRSIMMRGKNVWKLIMVSLLLMEKFLLNGNGIVHRDARNVFQYFG